VKVGDASLVWTGQVVGAQLNADGRTQAEAALDGLGRLLPVFGSELGKVARLTAYVADEAAVAAVQAAVDARFSKGPVAFTLVRTPLATKGAVVAFEAVAVGGALDKTAVTKGGAAVMPAGEKVFISGQAEKGTDLASAVKATMAGLQRSVTHLGLKWADVVQVKAFIRPFGEQASAVKEIEACFAEGKAPPIVTMEWQSDLFAEIELVIATGAQPATAGGPLNYAWLPWLPKSPRYSSMCQVAAGTPLIFIGGLRGDDGDSREQMKTAYARLGSTLFEAGTGFRSLVKATYYLGDAKARTALGDIRDVYYDPARPPAASALNMASLGRAPSTVMIDLIAVPLK
jgi:enamine deaminase RidA (YjgF/YER057c/UK114 family)